MEGKAILYYLLLKFSMEPNAKTNIPLKLEKTPFVMSFDGGMHLDLKLRKKN